MSSAIGSNTRAAARVAYRQEQRARKAENAQATRDFARLIHASQPADLPAARAAAPAGSAAAGPPSLLVAPGTSPRDAWIQWLGPVFGGSQSCYFTGTYSDEYGYQNGLTLPRNVHKDFAAWLDSFGFQGRYIVGVEPHAFRDILHLHAILEGPFTEEQLRWVKSWWSARRGHARALPVLDGCASYVTKYALKGDTDSFEWRLT